MEQAFSWDARRACDLCFAWTPLNILTDGSWPSSGPCTRVQAAGRPPVVSRSKTWEEHMDDFVWIRVVTPDWEYTERLGQ